MGSSGINTPLLFLCLIAMPKYHDLPFVSGSPPMKITNEIRNTSMNHVESWVVADRINRDRNLRDKWISRHAKRLGLQDAQDELINKYGDSARAWFEKQAHAPAPTNPYQASAAHQA